ncbi:ATP-binding protein [Paenibacillus sp. Soil522]|uniref:ATP-binding protein n=1 Tax=Paenibacillus sp. Soil522 TaxID=1736388 RepID=UPI00138F110A|nr:ATP-binding protein [Paenibacillus sp. Soil522]
MFTDYMLFVIFENEETITRLQTIKGFLFIVVMAWLLYLFMQRNNFKRNQIEEMLRDSETRYRRIIKLSPEPITIHSDGILIYANDAALKVVGATKMEDVLGKPLFDFLHPDYHEMVTERIQSIIPTEERAEYIEQKIIRLDGEIIDVETSCICIDEYLGKPVIQNVIRDITERKRTEEMIRKSEKLSVVGQLAAGVAHEIRNPLTSLKGFLQLLNSKNLGYKNYFEIMQAEVERINFIVNEFMIVSNPQVVRSQEKKNVESIIQNIVMLLGAQANLMNVQIVTESESGLPLIKCDENQLKQVFINILKNALEAMSDGGIIRIQVKNIQPNELLIRFIDQGIGIPEDQLPKLGEPFHSTKETGTGLGLMVTNKIIEGHKGSITITSKVNQGTTVEIILPIE